MANAQKILLADSDAAASMDLARRLRAKGMETVAATDAIAVVRVARETQPDVIVLSGRLAGGGALTALKRIRSNVYTTNIPVIGWLADSGAREAELMEAGAQACLPAKGDGRALLDAIDRHMLQSLDFTEAPAAVLADPRRLEALAQACLLDTPPEATFDRLTRLAARLVGAPTALVSLVDKDRQFFKSQHGLGQPWAGARQTRLSHSFCQWVVSGNEPLVVPDATANPVLSKNLAVRDMGVVAYAGVPLAGRGGQPIGSFCAIDSVARRWSDEDLATLNDLAQVAQAYAVLESARRGPDAGGADRMAVSVHVAGNALIGVSRVLRRYGARLQPGDHDELLEILEEQAGHLVKLAP